MKVEEKRAGRGWRPQVVNLKNDFQKKSSGGVRGGEGLRG